MNLIQIIRIGLHSILYCLRPFYITAPKIWSLLLRRLDPRIAINHEHKFIYVRIPKAANSTIATSIYKIIHAHDPKSSDFAKESFPSPKTLSFKQANAARKTYYKFTFVRNPYTRILSAYLDKIKRTDQMPIYRGFVKHRLKIEHNDISFEDFCRYLKEGGLKDDPHWMPQHKIIKLVGIKNLNFIGKTENIGEDLNIVLSILFPDQAEKTKQDDRKHSTGASEKIKKYYTPETAAIIQDLYASDFSLFGYSTKLDDA